jgi:hypothetical protein
MQNAWGWNPPGVDRYEPIPQRKIVGSFAPSYHLTPHVFDRFELKLSKGTDGNAILRFLGQPAWSIIKDHAARVVKHCPYELRSSSKTRCTCVRQCGNSIPNVWRRREFERTE